MDEDVLSRLEAYRNRIPDLAARPLLYVVVRLRRAPGAVPEVEPKNGVAVGTDFSAAGRQVTSLEPKGVAGGPGSGECVVGARVAERLRLGAGAPLEIEPPGPATGSPPQPRRQFRISNRSEEHTSELQSLAYLVCRLLLEKKKKTNSTPDEYTNLDCENQRVTHPQPL